MTLEFKTTDYISNVWTSLLRLQHQNSEWKEYGFQTPGIWFNPDKGLHICSAISGDWDQCWEPRTYRPKEEEWTYMTILQDDTTYEICIGGKQMYRTENNQTEKFANVSVYASSPVWRAQPGIIRRLTIETNFGENGCTDDEMKPNENYTNMTNDKTEDETLEKEDKNMAIMLGSIGAAGTF